MVSEESLTVSGFLLNLVGEEMTRERLLKCKGLRFVELVGQTKWEIFNYYSNQPLRKGDDLVGPPPFKYLVLCRFSRSRFLFLSTNRHVADRMIDEDLTVVFGTALRKVNISIDHLVKSLTSRPTNYVLSFVHARVPAYGALLRSVSFYGDDLAEAALFRDNNEIMNCFTCGLRSAVGGTEIVRLGNDGAVSFVFRDPEKKVLDVELALGFLSQNNFLENDFS